MIFADLAWRAPSREARLVYKRSQIAANSLAFSSAIPNQSRAGAQCLTVFAGLSTEARANVHGFDVAITGEKEQIGIKPLVQEAQPVDTRRQIHSG